MAKEVKFTDKELEKIKEIQDSYANVQNNFGQLKLAQIRLDEQEIGLEESLKEIKSKEKEFLKVITEKYGQGNLNPETGVFTPTESSENKSA